MIAPHYESKNIDHLGLLSGVIDELNLVDLFNTFLPKKSNHGGLPHGILIKAMLLNGLGYINQRLYFVSKFFKDKPVSHLLGADIVPEQLNDDALGRTLEAIYAYGTTPLYSLISKSVCMSTGFYGEFAHEDTTNFALSGAYNSKSWEASDQVIHLTPGYSKDHRPDLNQAGLALIMNSQANLPIIMQNLSGNTSDTKAFKDLTEKHIASLSQDYQIKYIVADSKFYFKEHLQTLVGKPVKWLTRVPGSFQASKEVYQYIGKEWKTNQSEDGYALKEIGSIYGGIPQRWVVVYSQKRYESDLKKWQKRLLSKSLDEVKEAEKLKKMYFACETDAQTHLTKIRKKWRFIDISSPICRQHKKGYTLDFQCSVPTQTYQEEKNRLGMFILATNELDSQKLTSQKMLEEYKGQSHVEKGFRFLKNPEFLAANFYVNKPERLEALLFIMTLSLLVYAVLEHKIRKLLKENEQTFDNQLGKPTQKPTLRWIFSCFIGIHWLDIAKNQQIVLNINEAHLKILGLLGKNYSKYYKL